MAVPRGGKETLSTKDANECEGIRGVDFNQDCHHCINEDPGYSCRCDAGYREDNANAKGNCVDYDECSGDRGVDYDVDCHTCTNTKGSHTCSCDHGFELHPDGKSCIDVNECDGERGVDYNQDCHRCINAVPGYTCECNEGFIEDNSTLKGNCVDIDECLGERGVDYDRDCHKCINTNGSHTCGCDSGYELHLNGTSCVDIPRSQHDLMQSHSKQFPKLEYLEENEYDEIGDISIYPPPPPTVASRRTGAVPYITPETHYIAMDSPKKHTNPTGSNIQASQSDKTKPKATLSKTTKTMENTSDEKLGFAQVDDFRGKWSFLVFQCPKGSDAVEKFWKLVNDRTIQSVVLFEDVSSKVLPAVGSVGSFNDIKVICKEEWQKRGIKKFTVTLSDEQLCGEAEFANKGGICVLTVDHESTNKDIISLRQNLISSERSPTCAIMCKDGQQFSGFFISVNCMLDMADEGNKIDIVQGLQQFKTVRPDFAPTDEQILQLSHLAKDYGSYGMELK
ncbi:hypothetical protein CAPTEDRAFT_208293 [Capitella teleta]|uniref:EGF-like domain-containing protein n=1 Tax=Capitella teleta TaxID=283909 RepID=R7T7V3_CAPTE|nr:hypothetical protein CAPTEDRAFT_208293 [Capitella teleta]|eukprot:ELT87505.1 hypothetical protein CAPTEDRAFT_208293 [Capitella teleta]